MPYEFIVGEIIVVEVIVISPYESWLEWQSTVSFHNFKSRNFKLSVSNPESKYVAYLFVLSQISNCQGLGRKNKHEILKTDRTTTGGALLALAPGSLPVSPEVPH